MRVNLTKRIESDVALGKMKMNREMTTTSKKTILSAIPL